MRSAENSMQKKIKYININIILIRLSFMKTEDLPVS